LNRKEIILIIVTVALVIVMGCGFFYDRTGALLDRTNLIPISSDENLEVEDVEKYGMLFYRVAYEARLKIVDGYWEQYYMDICDAYMSLKGLFMDKVEFEEYRDKVLTDQTIIPQPKEDAVIWVFGSTIDAAKTDNVVYIIDQEDDGNAYLYIYYSRK